MWQPSHEAHLTAWGIRVAYSFDRIPDTTYGTAKRALFRMMPQIEKVFSGGLGRSYSFANATTGGRSRMFYYLIPKEQTDYITFDLKVQDPSILLSVTWTPYKRGSQDIDLNSMEHVTSKSAAAELLGIVAKDLASQLVAKIKRHDC